MNDTTDDTTHDTMNDAVDTLNRLRHTPTTPERALAFFDELPEVECAFMRGRWVGSGFPTGHPMDGLLEATGWYGKEFVDSEHVHPLLFRVGGRIRSVRPLYSGMKLALSLPLARFGWLMLPAVRASNCLLQTTYSHARLRMLHYRGRTSATMIYDRLPVNDVFRRVDADTVLGLMDYKGMSYPFFFVLTRDRG